MNNPNNIKNGDYNASKLADKYNFDYLNRQRTNALNNINTLLGKKFGTGYTGNYQDYDVTQMQGWDNQEMTTYLKYMNDLNNSENALGQANQIEFAKNQANAQQGALNQLNNKYGQMQLQAQGLGGTGVAESTLAANNVGYANNVNSNNQAAQQQLAEMYSAYSDAKQQSDTNYLSDIQAFKEKEKSDGDSLMNYAYNDISGSTDLESLYRNIDRYYDIDKYGDKLTDENINDVVSNLPKEVQESTLQQYKAISDNVALEKKNAELVSKGINPDSAIPLTNSTTTKTFGKFVGYKDSGSEQGKYMTELLNRLRTGKFSDIYIDVNYGAGTEYYYFDGNNFYRVSKKLAEKNDDKIIRAKNYEDKLK